MLDCGTVNVKYCEVYYECLNGNIFKECDCANIGRELYICKTEVFGKKLISILLGGGENRISNSIYKTDQENKDHKRSIISLSFLCRTSEKPLAYNSFDHRPW